jgi:hypothetical protein
MITRETGNYDDFLKTKVKVLGEKISIQDRKV